MIESQKIVEAWKKKRFISVKKVKNDKHVIILECHNEGVDPQYIAKALNISDKGVYWIINKYKK